MSVSKKLTIAGTVVCLILGAALVYKLLPQTTKISTATAVLVYNRGETNIATVLTNEEALLVHHIFDGKRLTDGDGSGNFTSDVSIRFGNQIFCISLDSYPLIKIHNNNKTFTISDKDRETIEDLFERYGAPLPSS